MPDTPQRASRAAPLAPWERSPFVGRARELNSLDERLDAAERGAGGVVLISGEPGIGKSRLLNEFAERARDRGWLVLFGRAYETEGVTPYIPFAEALRQYVRATGDEDLKARLANAPEIALLIPEVRDRVPIAAVPSLGAEADRFRLFESVIDVLLEVAHAGETRGLVLCLDDLQWADRSSLLLFLHVARKITSAPVLVIATCRSEAIDPTSPIFETLAELSREQTCQRLTLSPLSQAESTDLIERLQRGTAAAAVGEAVYTRAAGLPFFLIEVVRHLEAEGFNLADGATADADWGIPEGVRQVIGRRLSRLQPATKALLQAGSVLGDVFSAAIAGRMTGVDSAAIVDALEEATAAGIVRPEGTDYRFSHALVQETLYGGLSPARRQQLHALAARAIEEGNSDNLPPHLASLAVHLRLAGPAGDRKKAIDYSVGAGDAAFAVFAFDEAVAHYEGALSALDTGPDDPSRRCDILLALIKAQLPAGRERTVVQETAPAAYAIAEALNDRARMSAIAVITIEAVGLTWAIAGLVTDEATLWLNRAEATTDDDTVGRVYIEATKALRFRHAGRSDEWWEAAMAAYRMAQRVGVPEALERGSGYGPLNGSSPQLEHLEEMLAINREMASVPRGTVPAYGRAGRSSLRTQAYIHLLDGNRATFDAMAEELRRVARSGDPFALGASLHVDMMQSFMDGSLEEALSLIEARPPTVPYMVLQLAFLTTRINLYLGRVQAAAAELDKTRGPLISPQETKPDSLLAAIGRIDEAASGLRAWLAKERGSEAVLGELTGALAAAVVLEDVQTARSLVSQLAPVAYLPVGGALEMASVGRFLGAAARLAGDYAQARSFTETAIEATEKIRFRPEVALSRLQLAELLRAHYPKERDLALQHLDFVISEFQAMGMQPALDKALRLRNDTAVAAKPPRPAYPDGLSAREVEVLRLIAAGKSNQQIADELFISFNTVQRHVSNVFTKTGLHNRTEAATYAHKHDLA